MEPGLLELFDRHTVVLDDLKKHYGLCEVCKDTNTVAYFKLLKKDSLEDEGIEVHVCERCCKELMFSDDCNSIWKKKASFTPVSFSDIPKDADELFLVLEKKLPTFSRKLTRFFGGDVTLDDGSEHPLLQSIAEQVSDKMRLPTEPQAIAFCNIFDNLIRRKRVGGSLKIKTEEEKLADKIKASKLLTVGMRNLSAFGLDTRKIIESMNAQFEKKGHLTDKQIDFLHKIVTELPDKLLKV